MVCWDCSRLTSGWIYKLSLIKNCQYAWNLLKGRISGAEEAPKNYHLLKTEFAISPSTLAACEVQQQISFQQLVPVKHQLRMYDLCWKLCFDTTPPHHQLFVIHLVLQTQHRYQYVQLRFLLEVLVKVTVVSLHHRGDIRYLRFLYHSRLMHEVQTWITRYPVTRWPSGLQFFYYLFSFFCWC